MTTPINTFQDILNALDASPALRDELRRHILGEELLQLPAQFRVFLEAVAEMRDTLNRTESNVAALQEGQSALHEGQKQLRADVTRIDANVAALQKGQEALRADVTRIDAKVDRMGGTLSRLDGTDYESYAATLARRRIRTIMRIPGAQLFSTAKDRSNLRQLADDAVDAGRIIEAEADDLDRADVVLTAVLPSGAQGYILGEISITAQQRDVDNAIRRAALLAKAAPAECLPIVLAQRSEPNLKTGDATLLIVEPEASPGDDSPDP